MPRLTVSHEPVAFPIPPQVERLMPETFTQKEIAEVLDVPVTTIIDAVSRFKMFLISEPVHGLRRFHLLDVYTLLIYISFVKAFGPTGRKTLVQEVSALLFGEQLSEEEIERRRAGMEAEYDAATPSGRAKMGGRLFLDHLARRAELREDPFKAHPLFWSRNYNEQFVLFGRADHRIVAGMFDRRINNGKIDMKLLADMKLGSWVNCTEWLFQCDSALLEIVERRASAELVEA